MKKLNLKPGDICPCCGQKIRGGSEKQADASRKNGAKGGRPVNPESARQRRLKEKNKSDQ